jgi:RNA polymerase sigma-70 factor (ECF subfamily)
VIPQTTAGKAQIVIEDFRTNESVLISVLCKKDERAFCFLYDKYAPVLYGVILKIVKSEDVANSVLNDVFCSVWKTIGQFDNKCRLLTWLLRIANKQAINRNYIQENLVAEIV